MPEIYGRLPLGICLCRLPADYCLETGIISDPDAYLWEYGLPIPVLYCVMIICGSMGYHYLYYAVTCVMLFCGSMGYHYLYHAGEFQRWKTV